jgi:hypothetical protein
VNARHMRKVREHVVAESKSHVPYLHINEVARRTKLSEAIVTRCLDALGKEQTPLISQRRRSGWRNSGPSYYEILTNKKKYEDIDIVYEKPKPRRQKPSWGNKKRTLALIRKTKPWVIEMWWSEPDERWWMYVEASHGSKFGEVPEYSINPEDQPDLTRTQLTRWHFDIEEAIQMCATLRRRYPKHTFRTRDTSAGDYVMGAIL